MFHTHTQFHDILLSPFSLLSSLVPLLSSFISLLFLSIQTPNSSKCLLASLCTRTHSISPDIKTVHLSPSSSLSPTPPLSGGSAVSISGISSRRRAVWVRLRACGGPAGASARTSPPSTSPLSGTTSSLATGPSRSPTDVTSDPGSGSWTSETPVDRFSGSPPPVPLHLLQCQRVLGSMRRCYTVKNCLQID